MGSSVGKMWHKPCQGSLLNSSFSARNIYCQHVKTLLIQGLGLNKVEDGNMEMTTAEPKLRTCLQTFEILTKELAAHIHFQTFVDYSHMLIEFIYKAD